MYASMVETERLRIIPLSYGQLTQYVRATEAIEHEFGLFETGRSVTSDVKEMAEGFTLPRMKYAKPDKYIFYTFWLVIDKKQNLIVGELGFKGEPDRKGQIEIGYGIIPDQQGKGYMTEAL